MLRLGGYGLAWVSGMSMDEMPCECKGHSIFDIYQCGHKLIYPQADSLTGEINPIGVGSHYVQSLVPEALPLGALVRVKTRGFQRLYS